MNLSEYTAGELLRDDLESMGLLGRVDAVLFTGDFVWTGDMPEFLRARDVVEEILEMLRLEKTRMLLIPGNHDVRRKLGKLGSSAHVGHVSREYFDAFLELLNKPSDGNLDVLEIQSRSGRSRLRVLGLDSNHVEGTDATGIGCVAPQSLRIAHQYMEAGLPESRVTPTLTWLAVHHHIFPTSPLSFAEAGQKKTSVTGNAAGTARLRRPRWGIEMALHGHGHQPSVTVARRWPIDEGGSFTPVASIGAGSFGAVREHLGPFARNHYYVIHRRSEDIIIRSRFQGVGGVKFNSHADLQIPLPAPRPPRAGHRGGSGR